MTTSRSPVFLDANVPLYAAGSPHPYKDACVLVLRRIALGSLEVVTSAEVLQEILHHFLRVRQPERGLEAVEEIGSLAVQVLPVEGQDIREAARLGLRHRGLPSRDLLHLAVMHRHHLGAVLSTDRHFSGLEGITRIDPKDV